jgi:hypothetical protein
MFVQSSPSSKPPVKIENLVRNSCKEAAIGKVEELYERSSDISFVIIFGREIFKLAKCLKIEHLPPLYHVWYNRKRSDDYKQVSTLHMAPYKIQYAQAKSLTSVYIPHLVSL